MTTERPNRVSQAASNGLALSLITIISVLIQQAVTLSTGPNLLLWVAKTVGSFWLLYYFMKEYSKQFEEISYRESYKFGFLVALFSSLACAIYLFLHYKLLFPESVAQQLEMARELFSDSNPEALQGLDMVADRMAEIIFLTAIIYYSLIGLLASLITANFTKKTTPWISQ